MTDPAPFFPPHEVHVGRDLGGRTTTIAEADVAHYETGTGGATPRLHLSGAALSSGAPSTDASSRGTLSTDALSGGALSTDTPSRGASSADAPVAAPALLFHSEVYRSLAWYLPNIFGNLHARQEWQLFAPLVIGETVRSRSTVVERYVKRGREYVVNEVLITDAAGRWLQRSRTHQSFLIEEERRGLVVDRERENRIDRQLPGGDGPGESLPPLVRPITIAMCEAFSGPDKNYHTDRAAAQMLGFPDIVVQGMLSVCFLSELMTQHYGVAWQRGGTLDVRLINVVWVDDVLTAYGKVREEVAEGAKRRVHVDVWCAKADGTTTTVGTASVLQ